MRFKQATRNAYAAQSSGSTYPTKGEAISRFNGVLQPLGVMLDPSDTTQMHGDEGRVLANVVSFDENGDETDKVEGAAVITWYRQGGRWEIISYLA